MNEELFFDVLRSFAVNTPPLIDKARNIGADDIDEYTIAIHGIKGSCRTIVAHDLAKKAEELEYAAKRGDNEFLRENNDAYLDSVIKFIDDIKKILG